MRRILLIILSILLIGSMSGPASAASIKVRTDPNDVPGGRRDIRSVSSDFSDSGVYLAIETYGRFFHKGNYPQLSIYMDTHGTGRWDSYFEVLYALVSGDGRGWHCFGYGLDGTSPDETSRPATRPTATSVACHLPRTWFPAIHRAVRFVVYEGRVAGADVVDRAPDHGVYRWL